MWTRKTKLKVLMVFCSKNVNKGKLQVPLGENGDHRAEHRFPVYRVPRPNFCHS